MDQQVIIQRLKSYVKENGITQSTLAKRIGVSAPILSRWLNGNKRFNPTLKQLLGMADIFGVTLVELASLGSKPAPTSSGKATRKATKATKQTRKTSKDATATKAKASKVSGSDEKKPSRRTVKTSAAAAKAKVEKTKKADVKKAGEKTRRSLVHKKPAKVSKASAVKTDTTTAPAKKRGRPRKVTA